MSFTSEIIHRMGREIFSIINVKYTVLIERITEVIVNKANEQKCLLAHQARERNEEILLAKYLNLDPRFCQVQVQPG